MTNDTVRRRVVKLGGSVMTADYGALLRHWLAGQPPAETLVVIGGGEEIAAVAAAQERDEFDDAEAHWLCIEVMRQNAQGLHVQVPEARWLADVAELADAATDAALWIVDPWRFMREDARGTAPLPESWDVSSDSIAARLAENVSADELVLLKSRLPRDPARLGRYVDVFFKFASRRVPRIRFVNARSETFAEIVWRDVRR